MHSLKTVEVARILNVTTQTVRAWNKKGLISSKRDVNNHRCFDMADVERLKKEREVLVDVA